MSESDTKPTENVESKLKIYQREMKEDLELDRIILEDKQMFLPGIKGKWVARLMNHKTQIDEYWELHNKAVKTAAEHIKKNAPVQISQKIAEEQAKDAELPMKIRKCIKEQERIVEYLEKMEKILSSMSFDIGHLVELIKLETV